MRDEGRAEAVVPANRGACLLKISDSSDTFTEHLAGERGQSPCRR